MLLSIRQCCSFAEAVSRLKNRWFSFIFLSALQYVELSTGENVIAITLFFSAIVIYVDCI